MALALVAGLAAPGTEGPGPPTPTLTLGGGFVTGQRAQPGWAGKVRVNGATAWAQVARGPWSIQAGWVGQHEAVTVDPAPVDPAADPAEPPPEPGPTLAEGGPAWDQAAGALATYAHPWFAMGLGVGWRRTLSRRRDTARADDRVLPVGHVRLGPPWL
ncbi:MAG: hypothetical protein KC613_27285, partial [Myxococcales bacterium]|nr:hypothetical protein [Myxococcales bacterium]